MMESNLIAGYEGLKLLIVSSYWPTKANPISGIFVVQQVEALLKLGVEVTVLLGGPFGKPSMNYLNACDLKINFKNFKLIESKTLRLPESLSSMPCALKLNTLLNGYVNKACIKNMVVKYGSFDGCIVHGLRYSGLSAQIWLKEINGNSVIVVHGVDPYFENVKNIKKSQAIIGKSLEFMYSLVVVGSPLLSHLNKLGIKNDKIKVIANGTKVINLNQVNSYQRSSSEKRIVLSVSNLTQIKGIDYNLKALSEISMQYPETKWEYRIVGDGAERDKLIRLSKSLGISDQVVFLGRLSYEDTMHEIANADIFSLPSWGEAFGIVYLEAMMRMKPVIGCFENGAADIIDNNYDGILIPPKNYKLLADALLYLIRNPEQCGEMGEQARLKAEKFSWTSNAENILKYLKA